MDRDHNQARIGIFWRVTSRLIFKAIPLAEATPTDGIFDVDFNHYSFWEGLRRTRPVLSSYAYDYFPRGRIVFDQNQGRFFLYGDRCLIGKEQVMRKVLSAFAIDPDQCDIRYDFHYQCKRCNPEYLSDF